MHPNVAWPAESITVIPWDVEGTGHDSRCGYVEEFWLGVLGPSTTWLLRRLAGSFDEDPDGFELPFAATARILGLGDRGGRHSPFVRSVNRLILCALAIPAVPDRLAVRHRLPTSTAGNWPGLGPERTAAHQAWLRSR